MCDNTLFYLAGTEQCPAVLCVRFRAKLSAESVGQEAGIEPQPAGRQPGARAVRLDCETNEITDERCTLKSEWQTHRTKECQSYKKMIRLLVFPRSNRFRVYFPW